MNRFSLLLLAGLMGGCLPGKQMPELKSADTLLSETISPDRKHVATVFERDVNATVDFSTMIAIRRVAEKFDPEQGRVFVASGRHKIGVTWIDSAHLKISCDINSADIFKKENAGLDSIVVTYRDIRANSNMGEQSGDGR